MVKAINARGHLLFFPHGYAVPAGVRSAAWPRSRRRRVGRSPALQRRTGIHCTGSVPSDRPQCCSRWPFSPWLWSRLSQAIASPAALVSPVLPTCRATGPSSSRRSVCKRQGKGVHPNRPSSRRPNRSYARARTGLCLLGHSENLFARQRQGRPKRRPQRKMPPETADRQNLRRHPPDMSRISTDCAKCARTREWLVGRADSKITVISIACAKCGRLRPH